MFNKLYAIKYDALVYITRKEPISPEPVLRQGIVNCTKYIIARSKKRAIQELHNLYGVTQPVTIKEVTVTSLWKPVIVNKDLYK